MPAGVNRLCRLWHWQDAAPWCTRSIDQPKTPFDTLKAKLKPCDCGILRELALHEA